MVKSGPYRYKPPHQWIVISFALGCLPHSLEGWTDARLGKK
jgi:hypothetical protein